MTAGNAQQESRRPPEYDVAVIGSGLAGFALAAVLARGSLKVLLIDAGHHPRFAIGESVTPQAAMLLRVISDRYDVPEIKRLAAFDDINSAITTSCGIKRNDGYIYHRTGAGPRSDEAHQSVIAGTGDEAGAQSHLFRQDTDAWLTNVAVGYGAVLRQRIMIAGVAVDADGVTLTDGRGQNWRARYVIDASDESSPLATALGLREEPTRLRHRSRSLFTHMLRVTPYDETLPQVAHNQPSPWHQGTLHHVFEGGWLWVMPFGNHPRATNRVTSVGLNLDPRVHGDADGPPEDEFRAFIARFSDVARQFGAAREIRPWVRSGPAQYSCRATVGPRWCVTAGAAGSVDPLSSSDLTRALTVVNALAGRLLEAAAADDFSVDRFAEVQKIEQGSLDFTDDLAASTYTAFADYGLWDAWFRVRSVAELFSICEISRTYAAYADSRDPAQLRPLDRLAPQGWLPGQVLGLLTEASGHLRAVAEGDEDPAAAEKAISQALSAADFVPPALRFAGPGSNWPDLRPGRMEYLREWAQAGAPSDTSRLLTDGLRAYARSRSSRPPETDGSGLAGKIRHAVAGWPAARRRQGSYSHAGH